MSSNGNGLTNGKATKRRRRRIIIGSIVGLVLVGGYLAKGGLASAGDGHDATRIALARFAAENLLSETAALKDRIINGAESLAAARAALG